MSEIEKLMGRVASHLCGGRSVTVRIQEPVWDLASGASYKTLDGRAVVDVNPGAADVFFSFLHEVSHLRNDFTQMTPTDVWREAPGSLTIPPERRASNKSRPMESKADSQAEIWRRYALENAWRFWNASNPLEKNLLALLELDPEPVVSTKFVERWRHGNLK